MHGTDNITSHEMCPYIDQISIEMLKQCLCLQEDPAFQLGGGRSGGLLSSQSAIPGKPRRWRAHAAGWQHSLVLPATENTSAPTPSHRRCGTGGGSDSRCDYCLASSSRDTDARIRVAYT